MEKLQHPLKRKSFRRFLLVLPLLVIPIVTALFIALGGGGGWRSAFDPGQHPVGLNVKLPDAHLKRGKEKDKLGLYEQAIRDSAKILEAMKSDPYYKLERHLQDSLIRIPTPLQLAAASSATRNNQPLLSGLNPSTGRPDREPNDEKLVKKLEELRSVLNNKSTTSPQAGMSPIPDSRPVSANYQVSRLESMMRAIQTPGESDPQMERLERMLDKIERIEHPGTFPDSLTPGREKNTVAAFEVCPKVRADNFSVLENQGDDVPALHNGFYGLDEENTPAWNPEPNAIRAATAGTQTLVSGQMLRIRILQDITIGGVAVPKGTEVAGMATLSGERLKVMIQSVIFSGNILPVSLEVYDEDGLPGIHIPGSISRQVSKETADQAIGNLGLASLDPSLGAQAASAGIQAAKSLLGKKIKLVSVTLRAGYPVLLKDASHSK